MTDPLRPKPIPANARCVICEAPIPVADLLLQKAAPYVVCRQFDCQRLIQQLPRMNTPQFNALLAFHRRQLVERREREQARQHHQQQIEANEAAENQALLEEFLAQHPDRPSPPHLMPLPKGINTLMPVDPERRTRFMQHLEQALAEATACANVTELPQDQHYVAHERCVKQDALLASLPRLQSLSDQLCTLCQGGCCSEGADHAYLSAVSLRRQLDADPALTAATLAQLYRDHIPAAAMDKACLFQTEHGCNLPRELRSDVCNHFYCTPLQALQQQWQQEPPQQLLVIQRNNTWWNRYDCDEKNPLVGTTLIPVVQE